MGDDESVGTKFSCEDALAFIEEAQTVGFASVGFDGRFLCVSQSYCRILGATWRQIVGTSYEDWTHPSDIEADNAAVKELADGQSMRYGMVKRYVQRGSTEKHPREITGFLEVEAVWKDGKCHRYRVRFTPFGQTDGPKTVASVIRELTPWIVKNWKAIVIGVLTVWASIFGGSELVTRITSAIATVRSGGDSPPSP